ncbi:Cdc25 phosphatase Ibp1 [Rhodotorula kratochvilovae]
MNYQYLNADQLAELVRTGKAGKDYQVVDVRDEDFHGGNIPGAIRAPSELRTDQSVQDLVAKLTDVPTVIFHCSLSQVRGPKAARIYADAMLEAQAAKSAPAPDASAPATAAPQDFSPNPYMQQRTEGQQQVYVLRDGFSNWQGLYRPMIA